MTDANYINSITMKEFLNEYCKTMIEYKEIISLTIDQKNFLKKNNTDSQNRINQEKLFIPSILTSEKLNILVNEIYNVSDLRLIRMENKKFDGFIAKITMLIPAVIGNFSEEKFRLNILNLEYLSSEELKNMNSEVIINNAVNELVQDIEIVKSINKVLYDNHSDCIDVFGLY